MLSFQPCIFSCSCFNIGQQSSSDIPYADPGSWNSASTATGGATSQQQVQQQEKGKDAAEETSQKSQQQQSQNVKQLNQSLPTSQRPATASQILASIQNPSRSKLAPVTKPTGLDPVAILRERESR